MSPTSYRAAPPRVSEDRHYNKASQPRQTLYAFFIFPRMTEAAPPLTYNCYSCSAPTLQQRYNRRSMKQQITPMGASKNSEFTQMQGVEKILPRHI
jgi:hypothetical protein